MVKEHAAAVIDLCYSINKRFPTDETLLFRVNTVLERLQAKKIVSLREMTTAMRRSLSNVPEARFDQSLEPDLSGISENDATQVASPVSVSSQPAASVQA